MSYIIYLYFVIKLQCRNRGIIYLFAMPTCVGNAIGNDLLFIIERPNILSPIPRVPEAKVRRTTASTSAPRQPHRCDPRRQSTPPPPPGRQWRGCRHPPQSGPTLRDILFRYAMAFSPSSTLLGAKKVLLLISSSSQGDIIFQRARK